MSLLTHHHPLFTGNRIRSFSRFSVLTQELQAVPKSFARSRLDGPPTTLRKEGQEIKTDLLGIAFFEYTPTCTMSLVVHPGRITCNLWKTAFLVENHICTVSFGYIVVMFSSGNWADRPRVSRGDMRQHAA